MDVEKTMTMCTQFTFDGDPDDHRPCRCPECKGFLPGHFSLEEQFLCRKCGAVLKVYPSLDEYMSWDQFLFEVQEDRWGGRICLVPELAVKISTELPPKIRRIRKRGTDLWAVGIGFSRRVWEDRAGRFITIDGERLGLNDPKIKNVFETEVG